MELNYREMGTGEPLIILHGLYGSSDNWMNIGKALAGSFRVFLLDQRNHGQSPHSDTHTYEAMREDLREIMDRHDLNQANILGHSMGGMVATRFALMYPNMSRKLVLVNQIGRAQSELQSLRRISYAVFCLKKKNVEIGRAHV